MRHEITEKNLNEFDDEIGYEQNNLLPNYQNESENKINIKDEQEEQRSHTQSEQWFDQYELESEETTRTYDP